jgi:Alginate lyase
MEERMSFMRRMSVVWVFAMVSSSAFAGPSINASLWDLDTDIPTNNVWTDSKRFTDVANFSNNRFVVYSNAYGMSARMGGATTSTNTAYARMELRETGGWDCATTTRSLRSVVQVVKYPANKQELMLAQIHDGVSDALSVKYSYGHLKAQWDGQNTWDFGSVSTNDHLTIDVQVFHGDARVVLYKNGQYAGTSHTLSLNNGSCYFKTGAYNLGCSAEFVNGDNNQACMLKPIQESSATATSTVYLYEANIWDEHGRKQ